MSKKKITSCLQYDYIYRLLFFKSAKTKRLIDKKEIYNILSNYRKSDIDEMLTFWISEKHIFDAGNNIKFPTKKEMDIKILKATIKANKERLLDIEKEKKEINKELILCEKKLNKFNKGE